MYLVSSFLSFKYLSDFQAMFVTVLKSVNYFSNDLSNCNDELTIEQKNTRAFLS